MATHDPAVRKLRFLGMVNSQVHGNTVAQIAKEFNVSTKTVERTLSWGKRAGIIVEAEDRLLNNFLPLAEKAIRQELQREIDEGGATLAMKIYEKAVKGRDAKKANEGSSDDDELAAVITSMRKRAALQEQSAEGELLTDDRPVFGLLTAGSPANGDEVGVAVDGFQPESSTEAPTGAIDGETLPSEPSDA